MYATKPRSSWECTSGAQEARETRRNMGGEKEGRKRDERT
jgi:hypothetical protein